VSPRRVLIALTGASGAIYGWRLLLALRDCPGLERHLVVSAAGVSTLRHELQRDVGELAALVDVVYDVDAIGAAPASGSFRCDAMAIVPCSMRTVAAIAHGLSDNLITRAADVMLKERRRLVLVPRETPLHLGHLRRLSMLAELGAVICPPMPAFYLHPQTIDDVVDATVARVLDLLGIEYAAAARWTGLHTAASSARPVA